MPDELRNDQDAKQEPEQGAAPETPAPAKEEPDEEDAPQTFTVTVNGEKRTITLEEALKAYEKVTGADEKFRAAADLAKQAQKGIRISELLEKGRREPLSQSELIEYANLLGIPQEDVLAAMTGEEEEDEGEETGSAASPSLPKTPSPVKFEDLDPQLQRDLEKLREQEIERGREAIRKEVTEAVDKDKVLGKMIAASPDRAEAIRNLVLMEVEREAIVYGQEYGPDMVNRAIQIARSIVTSLGTPERPQEPALRGLGVAPSLGSESFYTGKPPKRVPVTDGDYEDVAVQRFYARQAQLRAGSQ